MQLVRKLGTKDILKANGKDTRKASVSIFVCHVCSEEVEKETNNGLLAKSCGKEECMPSKSLRHGFSQHPIYHTWAGMKQRCDNPKDPQYVRYGAKGIIYPGKWEKFEGFLEDVGDSYIEGYVLDRIDTTKSYSKENCQWITRSENSRKDLIKQVSKYTKEGVEIARYSSVKEAAEKEGTSLNNIARAARGERKTCIGFIWKYTNA